MSVLNQVLRDLDRRRASGDERGVLPDHVRALPPLPGRGGPARLVALSAVLAVAALFAAYQLDWWPGVRPAAVQDNERTLPPPPSAAARLAPLASTALADAPAVAPAYEALQPSVADILLRDDPPAAGRPSTVPARKSSQSSPAVAARASKSAAGSQHPGGAPTADAASTADIRKQVRKATPQQQADMDYEKAAALVQQGRLPAAREVLEALLGAHAAHAGARQLLTAVLVETGAYGDAERLLEEGLHVLPAHSGYAIALARLQVYRSDVAGATQTLQKHAEHGEQNADYQGFYAALLQRQQRHEEAIARFQAALRLRPHSAVWLMGLGISLQAASRFAEAQDAYRRARTGGGLTPELQAFVDQRLRQVQ